MEVLIKGFLKEKKRRIDKDAKTIIENLKYNLTKKERECLLLYYNSFTFVNKIGRHIL